MTIRRPPDTPLLGMNIGEVVDHVDPKGLGRVRVRIPGLIEPASAWAWPIGMPGGGSRDRGMFWPLKKGAEVAVWFKGGDVDRPYYMPANWGAPGGVPEVPSPAKEVTNEEKVDVKVIETEVFRITIDDRPTKRNLLVENKDTGDRVEFDGLAPGIQIEAKAALVLKALGVVNINGLQVVINGRVVLPSADPI